MPLYEYRCKACEKRFEYVQGISEGAKRKCEGCGGRLEKLVSRSGFILKGTGWYQTDFKGGGKPPSDAKSEGESSSGSSEGSTSSSDADSKGDSKGDSKADSKTSADRAGKSKSKKKAGSSGSGGTAKGG